MDPLEPNDPLWKLLGKSRAVEPRPNFTQNVLRAARQTPQTRGWWAGVREWFADYSSATPRFAVGVAAAAVLVVSVISQIRPSVTAPELAGKEMVPAKPAEVPARQISALSAVETPLVAVETQLENIDQVSALLALEDTSSLTDSEISFLLY